MNWSIIQWSLYQKLSISLLLTFILIFVSFFLASQKLESLSKDQAEQKLHHQLAKHLVHDNPLLASEKFDSKALENLFHTMMILGQNFEFYVLDAQGEILSFSAKPGQVTRKYIDIVPIQSFLQLEPSFPIYAQDPRSEGEKIFSAAEIYQNEELKGYLFIIVRSQIYDGIFEKISANEHLQIYGLIVIASLLFLLTILLVSFKFIIEPLRQLTSEVVSLEQSDSNKPLEPLKSEGRSKEVDALTMAFNKMTIQINQQFDKLKTVDADRRELLTHLSHDLRTPLASLQGFLETITIQKNDLSEKDREAYLNRCLRNARQLKHFVDQIFELAHLESNKVSAIVEPLPIAELLYDVSEKFSLKAAQKEIKIVVDVFDENIQTTTDIAKLERVLSNLVENAIRHTPKQGVITLRVSNNKQTKQLQVEVADTGSGIPESELKLLFDPRYRGSSALDDGERHIGMGLTITEKLLKVIGSEITATNNSDRGATFSFNLLRSATNDSLISPNLIFPHE